MIKKLFFPFGEIDKKIRMLVIAFWVVLFLGLFQVYHSPIVPSPTKITNSLVKMVNSKGFYEDLLASLMTTLRAMFYSILVTIGIVYLSTIAFFKPVAELISKCRYLTLTGLVFVFTMVSNNISELKMYLLMFGIIPFFVTSFLSIVQNAPVEERWKGYVNRLNRWETLWEVTIVGKLDMLFEVMRQNFAISWMMITMVEGYAMSEGGIGTLLIKGNKYLDLSQVFAILIIVLTLGLIFDFLLGSLRGMLFPYLQTRK